MALNTLTAAEALELFRAQWRRTTDPAERKRIEEDANAVRVLAAIYGGAVTYPRKTD